MGFRLLNNKWRIKYIPLVLAVGLCPEELHGYFHQQLRWCNGSMMLLFSREFWSSRLTFMQRLCFHAGFLYYITHAIEILLSFQLFILIFAYPDYLSFANSLPFIPYILFIFVISPGFRMTQQRLGSYITRYSHNYSYSYSLVMSLLGKAGVWHPTHSKKSRISDTYRQMMVVATAYILVYIFLVSLGIWKYDFSLFRFDNASVTFWVIYTVVMYGLHLWHSYDILLHLRQSEENRRLANASRAQMQIRLSLVLITAFIGVFFVPYFF